MAETKFKIYSLLVVKNEVDIISACLLDACRWSDKIIVLDNGSNDGTWECIQQLSQTHPQIVPFGQYHGTFHIGLRARLFWRYRREMHRGDWWCVRLDADEFYPGDVKAFLRQVPLHYRTVSKDSSDYLLSEADLPLISGNFEQDQPIFHHILPIHRRERRFVRHCPWLIWSHRWRYPHPMGSVYPIGIPVNHYQYRSVEQMQNRWNTRAAAKANGCDTFKHENTQGWMAYLWEQQPLDIEALFLQATHILQNKRNEIREINGIVIKSFAAPKGLKRIVYSFLRASKARRSYDYAKMLSGLTPDPVAYKEKQKHGLLTQSYYACKRSVCPYSLFNIRRDSAFPHQEQILPAIGRTIAQMHLRGAYHKDLSYGNILFTADGQHVDIIDLNRMRWSHHLSTRLRWSNFSRIKLDPSAMRSLLSAYAEVMHDDPEALINHVIKHL